jgi:hypothetical protein
VCKQILIAAVLASCTDATLTMAADIGANTTVGGQTFLDVSHITQQQNGADVVPTGTGLDVKRAYLIVDHRFDDVWSANLTTDALYSGSTGATDVFIKRLYLQANINDAFTAHVGSYNMPWISLVEGLYGYRYVEKTATDRFSFANTTDWGVNATGTFGNGLIAYSASVVNGGGFKNPTRTKDVDFEGRVSAKPTDWLTFGAGFYSGHLGQVTEANANFASNTATRWDVAAGVGLAGFRVGAEYFHAKNYKAASASTGVLAGPAGVVVAATATGLAASDEADGFSSWVSYSFAGRWSVFGRYDEAKLSKDIVPSLKDTYFNLGVAYKPSKSVDLALVYKSEKVEDGSISVGGADANGSYTIGGSGVAGTGTTTGGKFEEIGVFAQYSF